MGTKTVCVHRYSIPPLKDLRKKYYYMLSLLLFEYEQSGYQNNVEIYGFNNAEIIALTELIPYFYQEGACLKADDFYPDILTSMVTLLPDDLKQNLADHIVLSSIDRQSDVRIMLENLRSTFNSIASSSFDPNVYVSKMDFFNLFQGQESTFLSRYYSLAEQEELLEQYGLKR